MAQFIAIAAYNPILEPFILCQNTPFFNGKKVETCILIYNSLLLELISLLSLVIVRLDPFQYD